MLATNNNPLKNMIERRPKRSDNMPAKSDESTLPNSTAATIYDNCCESKPDVSFKYGSAPAIIPTSMP
jgi:hypothetical protein